VDTRVATYHLGAQDSAVQSHRTNTIFFLVYGSEAILPAYIMWKSPRVEMYNEGEVDKARKLELDSVEEARCTALVQSARYLLAI
jgi:hypothetical protein